MYRNLTSENYLNKEGIYVLAYYLLYLLLITIFPGFESANWISLVFLPLFLIYVNQRKNSYRNSLKLSLASFGIKKYNLERGIFPALLLGVVSSCIILFLTAWAGIISLTLISAKYFLYIPIAFIFVLFTTAIVEEFFFRAILQSRIERLSKNNNLAIFITSILFGIYHLSFFFLNQNFVQYNFTHITFLSSFGYGMLLGLVSGFIYSKTEENLLASVLYNALCSSIVTAIYFHLNFF